MLVGLIVSWFVLVPWQYTALAGVCPPASRSTRSSTHLPQKVRFIGAGTIGVAAIWTLLQIIGPIIDGHHVGARRQPRRARPGRAKRCR